MKDYLRWSARQFYLMYFWPTRFKSEVESVDLGQVGLGLKERAWYMLKILPWLVLVNVFSSLAIWFICEKVGIDYRWKWIGIVFGIAVGMAIGVTGNVFVGVVFGMFYSTAEGMSYGLAFAVAYGLTLGLAFSMGYFIVGRVKGGLALGMMFGVVGGAVNGEAGGVAGCVALWFAYFRLFTYPLDIFLSLFAYLYGKQSPQTIERAWRLCPVAWNEVIWLPLPFAAKLLTMLTIQDRKEGFRQIAFVAAERRLQTQVASHASEEIAINDLQVRSIKELANVTQELDWTTDAPSEMPEVLDTAFPRFERTARHADQYLKLNNNHRKREALERALIEVEGLQKSLIAAGGSLAPRLLQRANEWRALLESEQTTFSASSTAPREIPNPFVSGKGVVETENNIFTGRRDIVQQIEASMLGAMQTPTLLLHGPRRMGKTSILNQLPRLLGPDFAPSVVDCQYPAVIESVATLLHYLSRELSTSLRRRRVIVESLETKSLAREPFSVFDEWLESMEHAMPAGMRALLCLDEYESLQATLDAGWGGAFLDALRHILQHRPQVVLLFAGAHTFQELGPAWTDRFISARRVRVSFLTRDEVFPLLTQPIPEFIMTYAPGALDALFAATNGQPFLTQATAYDLVQLLNEQQRKEATPEDVEAAISRALVNGAEYFASVWNDAGVQGQAILRAIARGETPPDAPAERAWLREHDVLGSDGDFAVKMVRRWVEIKSF
ncbi:MAG TPA: ATP-binding protein [Pyrinomonadaceae bacterium]|nr:ATP-binding protein [Pyrinomonadaceae bacterium]